MYFKNDLGSKQDEPPYGPETEPDTQNCEQD